jgi:ECF sigma factor
VSPPEREVTELLQAWSEGNVAARDLLIPLVYEELRRRASLDGALERLAAFDARKSRIAGLRFFGGLSLKKRARCSTSRSRPRNATGR